MRPEDAPAAAMAEAERRRAVGGYAEPEGPLRIEPVDHVTRAQLLEWAVIEPDLANVRSTRPRGAPITWLKRMLLRALQQYHNEVNHQQTRFNLHVLRTLLELEERVERLENER